MRRVDDDSVVRLRRVVRLRSDVVGIVDELIGRIFDEMDYRQEAASIQRFYQTYKRGGDAGGGLAGLVRAPLVLDEISTSAAGYGRACVYPHHHIYIVNRYTKHTGPIVYSHHHIFFFTYAP